MGFVCIKTRTWLLSLFILLSALSNHAYAQSSVWKISKDGQYFYLAGTIHLLSEQDHPLPQAFIKAYKDSDTLVFETDIAAAKLPEFQQKFISAMTYDSGKTLKEDLNQKTYLQLKQYLASRDTAIEAFSQYRPWAVSLTISVMEYQRLGMTQEYGVEEYFYQQTLKDNKQLLKLETLDEQLFALQSMSQIEPNILINFTLRDLKELPSSVSALKNSWRTGDVEAFSSNNLVVQMKNDFPKLYATLVTNRNNNWMRSLRMLNNNENIEFVLVGAMHLNAEEGLLNQLKLAGFKVEQL